MRDSTPGRTRVRTIALVGNPNSGKSTVFNSLTGLRQKVGNYPGVTVEKHEGQLTLASGGEVLLLDLPGTYSLTPGSPDEAIAVDVLLGRTSHTPRPDLVLCVVDASNLERNLYLASQIIDRDLPVIVVLNMLDVAEADGTVTDVKRLGEELGVPVIPTVATQGRGIRELVRAIEAGHAASAKARSWTLPDPPRREVEELAGILRTEMGLSAHDAYAEAVDLVTSPSALLGRTGRYSPGILAHVRKQHEKLEFLGVDRESAAVTARYAWIRHVCARSTERKAHGGQHWSDRIDRVFTHRVWGVLVFLGLMGLMFQSIFSWAVAPMEWIGTAFDLGGQLVSGLLPAGPLRDLLVNGALSGVAAVVTFLPQIVLLFFFLGLLEDTGYMARAAYVMDRVMGRVGLPGRAFIPLLSSFACAIPGIMATRTIEDHRDRLATMFVAPFMSCSARLPVYTLMIGAFIPATTILGIVSLPAATMFGLYLLGLVTAMAAAFVLKKTLLRSGTAELLIELPPYKLPSLRVILLNTWERAVVFLRRAGTIILGASILLWFLASYPKLEGGTPSDQVQHSFAGRAGRLIEPVIEPLGFNWKIGIGLISSLFQREVFVSTMGTIYNIEGAEGEDESLSLKAKMQSDRDPVTGRPTFTALTALCVMVYYVLAMQCLSTVAVMRRETNSWRWPALQFAVMTVLAYAVTFLVYRIGLLAGLEG